MTALYNLIDFILMNIKKNIYIYHDFLKFIYVHIFILKLDYNDVYYIFYIFFISIFYILYILYFNILYFNILYFYILYLIFYISITI